MATNRRISEFPEIAGTTIDEPDLLTLVHVFEVDPVLRNKKITLSGFKDYLNQYYVSNSGGVFNGNVVIGGNLTVAGATNVTTITGSDLANFSGVFVQNNLEALGAISGLTITGTNGQFTNLTAVSGRFTDRVSGATITGDIANFTSGNFKTLFAANQVFAGNEILSGNLTVLSGFFVSGQSYFASGISVTGSIGGQTITGETANFTDITGSTLAITTPSGASPAIVCSGVVSGGTGGFIVKGPLVILP